MRLLLTGFEPFGGESVNPSWEVARALDAAPPTDVELTALRLPVRGRVSFERLLPAFDEGRFDAWLGLGEAGGRPVLSVERLGINLLTDHDAQGAAMPEQELVEDGPAAYFSRLPVRELARAMAAAGAPSQVSNTAGAYVCNEVTYVVQHHLAEAGRDVPSGFIHLPYLPEQVTNKPPQTPSMALDTQLIGVRAAVEFIRDLVATRAVAGATAG